MIWCLMYGVCVVLGDFVKDELTDETTVNYNFKIDEEGEEEDAKKKSEREERKQEEEKEKR